MSSHLSLETLNQIRTGKQLGSQWDNEANLLLVAQRENILNNLRMDMKWGKPPEFTLDGWFPYAVGPRFWPSRQHWAPQLMPMLWLYGMNRLKNTRGKNSHVRPVDYQHKTVLLKLIAAHKVNQQHDGMWERRVQHDFICFSSNKSEWKLQRTCWSLHSSWVKVPKKWLNDDHLKVILLEHQRTQRNGELLELPFVQIKATETIHALR